MNAVGLAWWVAHAAAAGLFLIASAAAPPEEFDVFIPEQDGFASIRIPALVVSKQGTLLAFAEGRAADADQAKNKIILKRSSDGGKSWCACAVIAADGDNALNNPCAVVEQKTGAILLMYQSYPAGLAERSGQILSGYEGKAIVRNWLITSDDDGVTWSTPRDLTRSTKREQRVTTIAGGPGVGIQLARGPHVGRILFPFNEGPFGAWNIYAVYSDDRGATWKMGAIAPNGILTTQDGKKTSIVNEAQFVELDDGSVRFNVRRWAGKPVRKTAVSHDGGETWSDVEDAVDLIDPGCMGSIIRYEQPGAPKTSRLLYSGPQSQGRGHGTVSISYDNGKTWPLKMVIQPGPFAYSSMAQLPDGSIGCLYEADGTKRVALIRFEMDWLETPSVSAEK
ncbi:Sialidase precursor [Pirellula sp. SH-Sr6A]|uniref:sialidase family protein n=1 Tax=Pirellula sp. SH-Sr6A TaxID=1632865 RepID=UPI00078B5546|nr:sialidase family protein [Pirellula sp. SH-Sr6A]AMV31440.1 Sialidase precursor [Pirellula sp. SH-Sr6A]